MPNFAFHLEVLNQVIDQLVSQGDSRGILMAKHKKFAALGAFGPDLLRYLPVSKALADELAQLASKPPDQIDIFTLNNLLELFRSPLGGMYSVIFRQLVVPTWPVLNQIKNFLDKMDVIAQTENLLALPPIIGQANTISAQAASLQTQIASLEALIKIIGEIATLSPWMQQTLFPFPPASDRTTNRLFEFLRWHYPSDFARNLLNHASTDQQKAFAFGYLSHVAASVTAEPFVNNITGGPYRTHWMRNQLVGNFIDSWTFGFFRSNAKMKGDKPKPPYAEWVPLCSANIQNEFNIAGLEGEKGLDVPQAVKSMASGDLGQLPNQFPDDLAQLLKDVVDLTYPVDQPSAGFSSDKFKEAFVGAYAVYWFMTSGSGPMCNNPLGPPPANCTNEPSWITSGSAPSPQQAGLNTQGTTCAVLLALIALLLILTGNIPGGVAALIAALNAPIIDWDEVRCNLFWLRKTLVDAEDLLRDGLVTGGLGYPPSQKLGTIDVNGNTQPATDSTPGAGVPLCRSNSLGSTGYPRVMDDTNPDPNLAFADLNFASYPLTAVETLQTQNLIPPDLYPNYVVNGTGLGPNLPNGMLSDLPTSPSSYEPFGDAVSNAIEVILNNGNNLQNYNLDADRGYGWKTWTPQINWTSADLPVLYDPE